MAAPNRRFPSNTITWLKEKVVEDEKYLPSIMGQNHYDEFIRKIEPELKSEGPSDETGRRKKIAHKLWTELNFLSESFDSETRELATTTIKFFRTGWRDERDAFIEFGNNTLIYESESRSRELWPLDPILSSSMPMPIPLITSIPEQKTDISGTEIRFADLMREINNKCCSICLIEYEEIDINKILTCGHMFHDLCIKKWKLNCPTCRAPNLKDK